MRIDVYLAQNGYADSRNKASKLIESGLVSVDGRIVSKPSEEIDETLEHHLCVEKQDDYVGRGGHKLEAAIETFGLDVTGKRCIDVGASTGGFTQCLLMNGAESVVAIDSGRGQLHKSLCEDSRVTNIEGYNARNLCADDFGIFDGAVMDVSFISQTLIIPALSRIIRENGFFVSLIKPQFEAGRQAIGKNGIVKSAKDREHSILRVVECAHACGLSLSRITVSPIKGGDGNIEYLAYFIKKDPTGTDSHAEQIKRLCREN